MAALAFVIWVICWPMVWPIIGILSGTSHVPAHEDIGFIAVIWVLGALFLGWLAVKERSK